jgi:hypothetical protein
VLPYSTTGYDNFGPEDGYTNVSVRANSSYVFTTPTTTNESGYTTNYGQEADVSEAKVLGVNESAKQVTLEQRTAAPQGATNNSSQGASPDYDIDPTLTGDDAESMAAPSGSALSTTAPSQDGSAVVAPAID